LLIEEVRLWAPLLGWLGVIALNLDRKCEVGMETARKLLLSELLMTT
jgi:hypothetical protein